VAVVIVVIITRKCYYCVLFRWYFVFCHFFCHIMCTDAAIDIL